MILQFVLIFHLQWYCEWSTKCFRRLFENFQQTESAELILFEFLQKLIFLTCFCKISLNSVCFWTYLDLYSIILYALRGRIYNIWLPGALSLEGPEWIVRLKLLDTCIDLHACWCLELCSMSHIPLLFKTKKNLMDGRTKEKNELLVEWFWGINVDLSIGPILYVRVNEIEGAFQSKSQSCLNGSYGACELGIVGY